jgi:hypothetical protein
MHERNHDRAFPHGRRNAFDVAASHITGRDNCWEAGFEQVCRRARGQCAVLGSSGDRSGPVLTVRRSRGARFVGVSS